MKRTWKTISQWAVVVLAFNGAAFAGPLTRAVKVIEGTETHEYLGTQFGQTLYTFDYDSTGKSVCNGDCAEKWPPLLVTADEAKSLAAPYGTIVRTSKLVQVTFHDKPVYTYYLDHAEGDDKGDGVGTVWHDIDFE